MGEVIAFGLPTLRVRPRPIDGFCEVTVLPGLTVDERNDKVLGRQPARCIDRKQKANARPTGAGAK